MRLPILLTLLATVLVSGPVFAAEAPVPTRSVPLSPRVRSLDDRVAAALRTGTARSAAFRSVLNRVEHGDVIAYVQMQPLLRGRLAGSLTWVTAADGFRYVRVSLNSELTGSELVATLAHELQHVSEIADAPSIVDSKTLSAFYREQSMERKPRTDEWDSEAARLTGELVRKEFATAGSESVANSIHARLNRR